MIPIKGLKYILWVIQINSYTSLTVCKVREIELKISFKTNKYMVRRRLYQFIATANVHQGAKKYFNQLNLTWNSSHLFFQITLCRSGRIGHALLKKLNHFVTPLSNWQRRISFQLLWMYNHMKLHFHTPNLWRLRLKYFEITWATLICDS